MSFNILSTRVLGILLSLFLIVSCATEKAEPIKVPEEPKVDTPITYSSDYKYNLNIIYFVPKDVVPNPGYEERLSKIMIKGQDFFSKWMNHWGFGDKTFGLLKNKENTRIKIHLVRGTDNASAYTDDARIKALVETYFQKNPSEKSSDHFLVLTATNKNIIGGESIGHEVPYYGVGRWCYALEYPNMSQDDLGKPGAAGEKATVYVGGLLHEMGHGINLPHNGPSALKKNDLNFGMTLMGSGNYTYGKSPTYLSYFDAVILNNCQVFSKEIKNFYASVTSKVTNINANYHAGNIVVSGKYTSSSPVKHITYRHILETDPQGYQSITFTQAVSTEGEFNMSMPTSEFNVKKHPTTGGDMNYTLQIFFHHENGSNSTVNYAYKFVNEIPVIDFGDREFISRLGWSVIAYSNQQNSGYYAATNVLDGNANTYWHTSWDNPLPHPHYITIKTGTSPVTANGLSIGTRHDTAGNGGKIKDFIVEVSLDNLVWTKVYEGTMAMNGVQYFKFNGSKTFQYFKITSLNDHEGKVHATLAEVNLY